VYGVLCEGDATDGKKELTVTPQAFHGQHKIISDGKIIAMAADKQELMALDPQIGGLIMSCAPERATQRMGVG